MYICIYIYIYAFMFMIVYTYEIVDALQNKQETSLPRPGPATNAQRWPQVGATGPLSCASAEFVGLGLAEKGSEGFRVTFGVLSRWDFRIGVLCFMTSFPV